MDNEKPGPHRKNRSISASKRSTEHLEFVPKAGKLPTPEVIASYAAIDPKFPQQIIGTFQLELKRNFRYQVFALVAGWTFALSLAVEAGVLTVQGHEKLALILIGANALGLATRMLTKAASRN